MNDRKMGKKREREGERWKLLIKPVSELKDANDAHDVCENENIVGV